MKDKIDNTQKKKQNQRIKSIDKDWINKNIAEIIKRKQ